MTEFERQMREHWRAVTETESGRLVLGLLMSSGHVLTPKGHIENAGARAYLTGAEDAARNIAHCVISVKGWSGLAQCMTEFEALRTATEEKQEDNDD